MKIGTDLEYIITKTSTLLQTTKLRFYFSMLSSSVSWVFISAGHKPSMTNSISFRPQLRSSNWRSSTTKCNFKRSPLIIHSGQVRCPIPFKVYNSSMPSMTLPLPLTVVLGILYLRDGRCIALSIRIWSICQCKLTILIRLFF